MKITHKDAIEVELNKNDIKKLLTEHFSKEFEGYKVTIVDEKTRTITTPGADPHDAFYDEVFDGLNLLLEKE